MRYSRETHANQQVSGGSKSWCSTQFSNALILLTLTSSITLPAQAQGMDYFFTHTAGGAQRKRVSAPFPSFPQSQTPPSKPVETKHTESSSASSSTKQQVLIWFEKLDDVIFTMGATDREKYILKRPINKEVERLNEWMAAADSLARKYRLISARIRNLKPPQSDLKELQIKSTDWYDDNAQLCEDLTEPRPPAKTYEELERAYKNFMTGSKNLVEVSKSVTDLSTKLRQKYDIHQPKYVDESAKYIDSVTHNLKG